MTRGLMVVTAAAALAAAATVPTASAGGWQPEAVPSRPNAMSTLTSATTAGESTWAFGSWHYGKDPGATTLFRRDAGGTWAEQQVPNVGEVTDSLALSDHDVWAVSRGSADEPILHFDGARWDSYPAAPPGMSATITSIERVGDELWAGGSASGVGHENQPLALRWDGRSWVDTQVPNDVQQYGGAVDGSGPADVWELGVGQRAGSNTQFAVAQHFDGSKWTDVPLPAPEQLSINDVDAAAPNDVWAVGSRWRNGQYAPAMLHYDGRAWTDAPAPSANGRPADLTRVDGALMATGGTAPDGTAILYRYDGTSWQPVPGTPEGELNDIAALADGRPLVVGGRPVGSGPYQSENLALVGPR